MEAWSFARLSLVKLESLYVTELRGFAGQNFDMELRIKVFESIFVASYCNTSLVLLTLKRADSARSVYIFLTSERYPMYSLTPVARPPSP